MSGATNEEAKELLVIPNLSGVGAAECLLDLSHLIKVVQAISSELQLDKYLLKMLEITIDIVGAQKGALVMRERDVWVVKTPNFDEHSVRSIALGASQSIPRKPIYYTIRTGESVVLGDASKKGHFTSDPVICKKKSKSILCMPLRHLGAIEGILFLENNLIANAFTPKRLNILEILSAQIMVSLKNAKVHSHLEEKIVERTRALQKAKEAADTANHAKGSFIANMSHEIRTPLNAILGYSQSMLNCEELNQQYRRQVSSIYKSGEHLLDVLNEILDFSKIEAGKVELRLESFRLRDLFIDLYEMFCFSMKQKGLRFEFELEDKFPEWIIGDMQRIKQILINLLGNAQKFTEEGGVLLSAEIVEECIWISVMDTGCGIAKEKLEDIFEVFEQDGYNAQYLKGTDLGLPISRSLARLMGGELSAENVEGTGACFLFTFPLSLGLPALDLIGISVKKPGGLRRVKKSCRLLIVDDNELNRDVLRCFLEPMGFEIMEAADGAEALDSYCTWRPDIVFMDLRMPSMGGIEATAKIRALETNTKAMIIALSASIVRGQQDRILECGADAFVQKPYREAELLELLEGYLEDLPVDDPSCEKTTSKETLQYFNEQALRLPASLRKEILNALVIGELRQIEKHIHKLHQLEPELADYCRTLSDTLSFEKLEAVFT